MTWYKKSQALAETLENNAIDLSSITPTQWQEINSRMVGLNYDFRGWEDTKQIFERLNNTTGGLPEDHKKALESVLKGQEYITKYSPQKIRGSFQKALRYFGLTNNLKEAGYILPNGTMLDLSGKNMGGTQGMRALDHRDVNQFVEMPEFISMGAIRHFPEQPGVDIRKRPTQQQMNIIYRDVENSGHGYVVEIIDARKGRFYKQYEAGVKASKVLNDIMSFYNGDKLSFDLSFHRFAH